MALWPLSKTLPSFRRFVTHYYIYNEGRNPIENDADMADYDDRRREAPCSNNIRHYSL